MHDPKFEKEVQQKMAELEFSPSESVWANVEKAVNKRRTRRAVPLFWRFALPGLLLLAGGGYYFFRDGSTPVTPAAPIATTATRTLPALSAPGNTPGPAAAPRSATASDGMQAATDKSASSTGVPASTGKPASTGESALTDKSASNGESASTGTPVSTEAHSIRPHSQSASTGSSHAAAAEHRRYTTKTQRTSGSIGSGDQAQRSIGLDDQASGVTAVPAGVAVTPAGAAVTPAGASAVPSGNQTSGSQREISSYTPGLAGLPVNSAAVHADKLPVKSMATGTITSTVKTLQSPRRPWEAAFSGGAGISSLHQTQLSNYSLASNIPATTFTTNSITTNAARPNKQYVSTVSPGASFWAGVLAQKPLSARWNLSLGLNLHYYSTRVRVGQQVSNYVPVAATLFTSSAVAPIQSYPYYSTGNEQSYTNRYYFLELPVAIEWKINRSHLLPLFWDGGFSLSYLMGSSAVYYNTHSGVYFKDGGVANHTQFNLSTAFMVGLPFHGIRIQAGPQVQYGLTPLLNTQQSGDQHIFYGGLRVVVFPGKK